MKRILLRKVTANVQKANHYLQFREADFKSVIVDRIFGFGNIWATRYFKILTATKRLTITSRLVIRTLWGNHGNLLWKPLLESKLKKWKQEGYKNWVMLCEFEDRRIYTRIISLQIISRKKTYHIPQYLHDLLTMAFHKFAMMWYWQQIIPHFWEMALR